VLSGARNEAKETNDKLFTQYLKKPYEMGKKEKFTPEKATKSQRGTRCIAVLFL
jgi:hypothetical protein